MSNVISLRNTGGFTRMENSLMDGLMAIDLPARELKVALYIAKTTLNFGTGATRITATEVAKATNIHPDVVSRAISHLLKRRVIFREGGARGDIGLCEPSEWIYFEGPTRTNKSDSHQSERVVSITKLTKTDDSLLYSKKEDLPLETVPSEQISTPQGADHSLVEKCNGVSFDGEDFQVEPALITKWAKAYSPVDVEAEIARAAVWAAANPRKAKKNWRMFLVKWLAKSAGNAVSEAGIPVDKIIDLYHRTCQNLPAVSVSGDKVLRALIVERWNESDKHQASPFWKTIFERANRTSQIWYRGANVVPRLEVICSRAVFRQLEEQA